MPSLPLQSEYQRSYKGFAFVEDDDAKHQMWRDTAGLSSMDLAVTREPALQHRGCSPNKRQHQQRKTPPLSHTVDALLDPDDGIGKSRSRVKEDKLQRHRLGYSLGLTAPERGQPLSEYNLQFNWKDPLGSSPLLAAENSRRAGPQRGEGREGKRVNGQPRWEHYSEEQDVDGGRAGRLESGVRGERRRDRQGQTGGVRNGRREGEQVQWENREEGDVPSGLQEEGMQEPIVAVEHGAHGSGRKRHKEQCRKRKKREAGKHRVTRIPLSTEYREQYREWPIVTPDKSVAPVSSLLKGIPPALLPPAGSPVKLHSPSDRRLQRHSPVKTDLPIVKSIPRCSEYQSNYQSPTRRSYVNGAWMGAPRPELLMEKDVEPPESAENGTAWLNQTAELREKCKEYKKRSRGTFFSRDYLDWLESQQQDLLDTASNGLLSSLSCDSSCSCPTESSQGREELLSVEDIEEPADVPPPSQPLPPRPDLDHSASPPPRPRLTHFRPPEVREPLTHFCQPEVREPHTHFRQPEVREPHTHYRSSPIHSDDDDSSAPSSQVREESIPEEEDIPPPHLQRDKSRPFDTGAVRRPTPELKGDEERWGQRHHLNLTTPFTNTLFSPSKNMHEHKVARTAAVSPKYRRDMKSRAPIFPTGTPQSQRVNIEGSSHQRDVGGARSHKEHKKAKDRRRVAQLKEHAPKTVPLDLAKLQQKHFHSSSSAKKKGNRKSTYIRQTQDGPICTVCGVNLDPLTAAAQRRHTYTAATHSAPHVSDYHTLYTQDGSPQLRGAAVKGHRGDRASPALESVSSLSMSSCSVASEVLERARERRDHFWVE